MPDRNHNLSAILEDPNLVLELPAEAIPVLLARLSAVQSQLTARLLTAKDPASEPEEPEEWIEVAEAAPLIKKSAKWFYRHARDLPFVRRIGPKSLLVSKPRMLRWTDRQKA